MKLREIIERVDRSDKNKSSIDQEDFLRAMNLNIYLDDHDALENAGFTAYYIAPWICTDTWVGVGIIFYKDKPVCMTYQPARKSDTQYEFIGGKTTVDEIFPIVANLVKPSERDVSSVDLDEEMELGIKLHYNQEILDEEVILDSTNERVKVLGRKWGENKIDDWYTVDILKDGVKQTVRMSEITIPWRIV